MFSYSLSNELLYFTVLFDQLPKTWLKHDTCENALWLVIRLNDYGSITNDMITTSTRTHACTHACTHTLDRYDSGANLLQHFYSTTTTTHNTPHTTHNTTFNHAIKISFGFITSSTIVILFNACASICYDAMLTINAKAKGLGNKLFAIFLGPEFSNT